MALWRRRSRGKRRRAVAGILAALLLFAMLFTVGTGYFVFVNRTNLLYTQNLTNRANDLQNTLAENLALTTGQAGNGDVTLAVTNLGGQPTTVVELFVVSPTGVVTPITSTAVPPLPLALNSGVTSAAIDTSVSYVSGSYTVKALTQRGAEFSVTYPMTATFLAAQALSSGAIGDLYLTFQSYTYYLVATTGCPTGTGYSTSCLQTGSGNSGAAFAVPTSSASGKMIAFSITLTDLNPQERDIVLDQFTLIYQNVFYGNQHVNLFPWYITSTGTLSGGLIPILSQYQPVVLHYNIPVTVYFVSSTCVQASQGPNDGCQPYSNAPTCSSGNGNLCVPGSATTVFILSNGWELAPGSYSVSSLLYNQDNYGQNSPFVSTLFY